LSCEFALTPCLFLTLNFIPELIRGVTQVARRIVLPTSGWALCRLGLTQAKMRSVFHG